MTAQTQRMKISNSNSDQYDDLMERLRYMKEIVDPRFLLESLGFKDLKENSSELRGACPIHGGDNTTSFKFNKQTNTWVCFSHGCNDKYGGDVIGLIRSKLEIGFIDAVKFLGDLTGDVCRDDYIDHKQRREREDFVKRMKKENAPINTNVNETSVKLYQSMGAKCFCYDGFSREALEHFEIGGGYWYGNGADRVQKDVVPIRDVDGVLKAYSLRDLRKDIDFESKYKLTEGFDKDGVLYNLHNIKDLLIEKPLILVEGFKSVWRLYDYGIYNVAAVMGATLTPGQAKLLYQYAFNGIIIMFDNDLPGIKGTVRSCKSIEGKLYYDIVIITETDENGKGLDPADLTEEQAHGYLRRYI